VSGCAIHDVGAPRMIVCGLRFSVCLFDTRRAGLDRCLPGCFCEMYNAYHDTRQCESEGCGAGAFVQGLMTPHSIVETKYWYADQCCRSGHFDQL